MLKRTRVGLNLRAIGESPATADAAGVNVNRYKYLATCIGGGICGEQATNGTAITRTSAKAIILLTIVGLLFGFAVKESLENALRAH